MKRERNQRIAILGSLGVPARYGGFETLAENLAHYHATEHRPEALSIYCSRTASSDIPDTFFNTELRYSRLRANGASSVLYDAVTTRDALARGCDVALLLGVSGASALPILRRRGAKIVTHVGGIEWQRNKWSVPARTFLRWSERIAVRQSDAVIADNPAIAAHLRYDYGVKAELIAYGGDHALDAPCTPTPCPVKLPKSYALALCRIEPENNVQMILEAFAQTTHALVFVGNWDDSAFGRDLKARYGTLPHLHLLDAIYEPGSLFALRQGAKTYIHGHSVGGTNPSLVEMMHFGRPVHAFDCVFNRATTKNAARFFSTAADLIAALSSPEPANQGAALQKIARRDYTWNRIGAQYFDLFNRLATRSTKSGAPPSTEPQFVRSNASVPCR